MFIFWIAIFIVSLIVLVKSADWLIVSSEKIGLKFGMSPFVVGVVIVGLGTSFPELISSFIAISKGVTDVVTANAVGSNIANILLIVGVSAVISRKIIIKKGLSKIDVPVLSIATLIFLIAALDKNITVLESGFLLAFYVGYLIYTLKNRKGEKEELVDKEIIKSKVTKGDVFLLVAGLAGLIVGAKYLIDALIKISTILDVATGVIAITAVSVGTSLPELLVSAKAALKKKSEIAIGNVFGSNVFNILVVVGLPGLFGTLSLDAQTFSIGLPVMAISTLLFVIACIYRRIHALEGIFFLLFYVFFIGKLFAWF